VESITKLTGHELVALLASGGSRLSGTAMSGAAAARAAAPAPRAAAIERPKAPAAVVAAAAAHVDAYVTTCHVAGAGNQIFGQQKTQLHTMWALRGLNPWSDPA
jgi:hypothetical protein